MTPLIDGDILLHELGWSGEFKDKETEEMVLLPFEVVRNLLDEKIRLICVDVEATTPPIVYLTSSEWICNHWNRVYPDDQVEHKEGFRYEIAKTKPYKGTRKNPKPFHFYNIVVYLIDNYDVRLSTDGLEADDVICAAQFASGGYDTIICSRDKDLRIAPGWHFSWECGGQNSVGPTLTDPEGWLQMSVVEKINGNTGVPYKEKIVLGYGLSFFYYQMLVGDSADNIPGLPKWGKVKAYDLLTDLATEKDLFLAVKGAYRETMGDEAKEYFMEQANLLWMRMDKGKAYELLKN